MADNPSITILAPYFPPRQRVGAIRPYRFAKYLSKLGWKVSVICIGDSKNTLTDYQKEEIKDIRVYSLVPPIDRTSKKPITEESKREKKQNSLVSWFDTQFPIDTWLPFLSSKRGEIEAILFENKTEILFSTSDPWSSAVMANRIASGMNIPWVADFRDPWTLCDTRFTKKGKVAQRVDERAERKIIQNANFVTFTSSTTEEKYRQYYPELQDKSSTIRNSFDVDIKQSDSTQSELDDKLIVLFLGRFRALSTAESIIELLSYIKLNHPELSDKIEVHSYGELEDFDKSLALDHAVIDKFIARKKVTYEEVDKEIEQANVLLLSTKPERDDIIPAKLFDYLPSGKPILSMVENPEVKAIIDETSTGLHTGHSELKKAANYLVSIYNGESKTSPNTKKIMEYSASHRAEELDQVLRKVLANVR